MVAAMQAGHDAEASAAIARFTKYRDLFGQDLAAVRQEHRMAAVGGVMVALASMLGIRGVRRSAGHRAARPLHRMVV
jgi:hypothetical protein